MMSTYGSTSSNMMTKFLATNTLLLASYTVIREATWSGTIDFIISRWTIWNKKYIFDMQNVIVQSYETHRNLGVKIPAATHPSRKNRY